MPKEDEPTGIIAPLKEKLGQVISALAPANIAKQVGRMRAMSAPELVIYLLTLVFWIICVVGGAGLSILGFFLSLMRGSLGQEEQSAKEMELLRSKKKSNYKTE